MCSAAHEALQRLGTKWRDTVGDRPMLPRAARRRPPCRRCSGFVCGMTRYRHGGTTAAPAAAHSRVSQAEPCCVSRCRALLPCAAPICSCEERRLPSARVRSLRQRHQQLRARAPRPLSRACADCRSRTAQPLPLLLLSAAASEAGKPAASP
eukprot:TRINITY_DN17464_c0_g1_i1.p2 TRINITY_DN17464_c0_g1~~TRINITY_DN17464_c0_g1_i1.p2  ORF type:complete len:152 (-),score=23.20 TRINITY_DN17464_c0_g1_i1:703-1158(-)